MLSDCEYAAIKQTPTAPLQALTCSHQAYGCPSHLLRMQFS